ncbi:MAG: carboxyl transferase domain-containing protein, partial [Bacteroidota bacterium]
MSKEILLPRKSYKERYDLIRHPDRIRSSDVIERVFENLCYFNSPDPNLIAARGIIDGCECIVLGQEKRRIGKESKATGMVLAKGYSFALDVLDIAEKECLPVVSIIDTFGGDSSMNSEIDGQSFLISDCISRFCSINVPTLSYIIGEGGSGGALALQVADRSFMLENALYSVIAPESCSRIIFHKRLAAGEQMEDVLKDALEVLRPGADHILQIGMIDEILPEPKEGAHMDYNYTSGVIRDSIIENLAGWMTVNSMGDKTVDKNLIPGIVKDRRMKVLNYGDFIDSHDKLAKREINGNNHEPIQAVDIEREDFHTIFIIKAHLERIGIEDTELYNCEKEWDKDKNLFKVSGGCGYISLKEYIDNFYSCPKCGKGDYLSVEEQIEKICDSNTFFEIEPDLTLKKLNNNERYYFGKYKDSLDKLEGTTFSKEGLVTGT